MTTIESKPPRLSNIELLRIIAMFMVLGVHANFYALGTPTGATINDNPPSAAIRIVLCITCCMCVNLFILISGLFSIKPSIKGFCRFIFQCLYFSLGIYTILIILGKAHFSISEITQCFYFSKWDWFIKAYIGLYILSPVLNAFVEKVTKKQMQYFLISFYLFQTLYSIRGSAIFICSGYSTFSFIGLYMIGRYLSIYGIEKINRKQLLTAVFIPIILVSSIYYWDAGRDAFLFSGMSMSYANPIMIIAAAALTMLFVKMKIKHNKIINYISASAFAAYLLHYDPHILKTWFCKISQTIFTNFEGLSCLSMEILFLITVFAISVLLDQPRKWIWNKLEIKFFRKVQ